MTEQTLCFSLIRPAHWEQMTADRNDGYSRKMWWARRWLLKNRERREIRHMLSEIEAIQRLSLFRVQAI